MSEGRFLVISRTRLSVDAQGWSQRAFHRRLHWERRGKVSFYSPGFSHLSRMSADARLDLWSHANRVEQSDGVDCYLERTLVHPFNTAQGWLSFVEDFLFHNYAERSRPQLVEWIKQSDTIILESGLPLLFAEQIVKTNPAAKMIYLASDDLRTIGCSSYLIDCLRRAAPSFDHAVLPSRQLAATMPPGLRLSYVPHGFNHEVFQGRNNFALCGSGQRRQRRLHAVRRRVLQDCVPRVSGGEIPYHWRRTPEACGCRGTQCGAVLPEMPFHETVSLHRGMPRSV